MPISIYRAIGFPFQKGALSFPNAATDDEVVKQSIIQIIMTGKGERVMRPTFGSGIQAFVFENNDDILAELIRTEVTSAVGKFEPRAVINQVDVTRVDTQVNVDIYFTVIATGNSQTINVTLAAPQ